MLVARITYRWRLFGIVKVVSSIVCACLLVFNYDPNELKDIIGLIKEISKNFNVQSGIKSYGIDKYGNVIKESPALLF
jgi:hypothetical protein